MEVAIAALEINPVMSMSHATTICTSYLFQISYELQTIERSFASNCCYGFGPYESGRLWLEPGTVQAELCTFPTQSFVTAAHLCYSSKLTA